MKPLTAKDAETGSLDYLVENLAKLKALFPEVVKDDDVNVDTLKQIIGKTVTDTEEKYGLNWRGKRKARHERPRDRGIVMKGQGVSAW